MCSAKGAQGLATQAALAILAPLARVGADLLQLLLANLAFACIEGAKYHFILYNNSRACSRGGRVLRTALTTNGGRLDISLPDIIHK